MGWPSFTKPLAPENIAQNHDNTLGMLEEEGYAELVKLFEGDERKKTK